MKTSCLRQGMVLVVFVLCVGGCKPPEEPYPPDQINTFVTQWAQTMPDKVLDGQNWGSPSTFLAKILAENAKKKAAAMPTKPGDKMRIPNYDQILQQVYSKREDKLGLVGKGGLTDAGKAVLEALDQATGEGFAPDEFPTSKLKQQIEKLEELSKTSHLEDLQLTDNELSWAKDQLKGKLPSEYPLNDAAKQTLTDSFLNEQANRIQNVLKESQDNAQQINQLRAEIEATLAKMYLHYAFLERFQHIRTIFIHPREDDFYNDPEMRSARPDKAKGSYVAGQVWRTAAKVAESARNETKLATENLTQNLTELLTSQTPAKVVAALAPQQPQYKKLVEELARYNDFVAAGGWKPIGSPKIRPGSKGQQVLALKKRLAAEGYDVSTTNDRYDDELIQAVKIYQQTHQYDPTGIPTPSLWNSINVPAERRRDQILLNIKRWRSTNMLPERDKTYVFVNIPDFNLELWDNNERKMRFAVVVGNNDSEIDEETRKRIWKNRTPVPLAAYIDRVIYNPYWNVTPRIREDEILPEVKKEVQKEYDDLLHQYKVALGQELPAPPADADSNAPPPQAPTPDLNKAFQIKQKIDNFPYLNKETGEIDVSKTDKNHIPAWYARNNYEVVWMGPNWEYVRMTQGPHNALGKVKVIFPNYYDVYLHDTPAKSKFKATTRAFSHGCIRMEEPLEFAEYLLNREGKYESENVPRILSSGNYRPIFFDKKIPVFLEYYTVRVDDHGRANFLADPYNFDADSIVIPEPPANVHLSP